MTRRGREGWPLERVTNGYTAVQDVPNGRTALAEVAPDVRAALAAKFIANVAFSQVVSAGFRPLVPNTSKGRYLPWDPPTPNAKAELPCTGIRARACTAA